MAFPEDNSQPKLATGCRWGGTEEDRVVLFPEGAIKVAGTGRRILEACDGERTFQDIVHELQANYSASDPGKIRQDIANFLASLQEKRIVDY
jgi:coenzyme PQQ biosynthesis protein PqqD